MLDTDNINQNTAVLQKIAIPIPNESVDFDGFNVVKLLKSQLDLSLVRFGVHNENKGVVLLDLLHRTLGVQRVENNLVGVKTRDVRDRLAGVLGRPRELEGLGAVEGGGSANLAGPVRMQLI